MGKAVVRLGGGICGFNTTITAWTDEDDMVSIVIESDCPNVQSLADDLRQVDPIRVIAGKAKDGPVFAAAAKHPLHHACPVPIGILKAVEVAAGYALPQDVLISIEKVE